MRWSIGSWRIWLFRSLVAVVASLMLTSAIMPWWIGNIKLEEEELHITESIKIYQYGIPSINFMDPRVLEYFPEISNDITPFYQIVLARVYIAASVGLILFSTWLKGRKGRWLLGGIGLIYIAYAVIAAFVVIAGRLGDFGISLQGVSAIPLAEVPHARVYATLQFGYYLAYAAGLICIALALMRNKIMVKPKLGA